MVEFDGEPGMTNGWLKRSQGLEPGIPFLLR